MYHTQHLTNHLDSTYQFRSHLCGYDLNLTYPQNGHFPTLNPPFPQYADERARQRLTKHSIVKQALKSNSFDRKRDLSERDLDDETLGRLQRRDAWKRDLSGRANGTIDPYYQCDLYDEMIDYAVNFSIPWSKFGPSVTRDMLT